MRRINDEIIWVLWENSMFITQIPCSLLFHLSSRWFDDLLSFVTTVTSVLETKGKELWRLHVSIHCWIWLKNYAQLMYERVDHYHIVITCVSIYVYIYYIHLFIYITSMPCEYICISMLQCMNHRPSLAVDKEKVCSATFVYQRVACTRWITLVNFVSECSMISMYNTYTNIYSMCIMYMLHLSTCNIQRIMMINIIYYLLNHT